MRYIYLAAMLLTCSGCASVGQGQQSLHGASMGWRHSNAVPAELVGDIINRKR